MIELQKLERDLTIKPAMLSEAENTATATYFRARGIPGISLGVDRIWATARNDALQASRTAGANEAQRNALVYRANLEVAALLADLLSIASTINFSNNPLAAPMGAGEGMIANTPAARDLLNSRPATKAWLAKRDAATLAAEEAQQAAVAQQVKDAPRAFLEIMRARGVHPELDGGSIIVPPGTDTSKLLATELRAFVEWKPQLVALLQAEVDVAEVMGTVRPMVLA